MAIAERPAEAELDQLAMPAGSLPLDGVRATVRRYRAGVASESELIAAIDRHGDALETEIARKAVDHMADFNRTVHRLEVLAGYVSLRIAQLEWLKRVRGLPGVNSSVTAGRRGR